MSNKLSWSIILIFDVILFIYSLLTRNIYAAVIALLIVIICEKFGYNILFKEYDNKKINKIKELKERRDINE